MMRIKVPFSEVVNYQKKGWTVHSIHEYDDTTSERAMVKDDRNPGREFKMLDKVQKRHGYKYPGIIVSVFWNLDRKIRYVVEADSDDFKGMLHIFKGEDLEER
jgi:hypothetical protein